MPEPATAPKVPCGSCPYRRDTPPGIWAREEYDKLPLYDGDTPFQSPHLFMCHQRDGCLCGGWIKTHGPDQLLAIRLGLAFGRVSPEVLDYDPPVDCYASGHEAAQAGIAGIDNPGAEAKRKMQGLLKMPGIKTKGDN